MNGQKQVPTQLQFDGAPSSAAIQAHPNQPVNITNNHSHHGPTYSFSFDFQAPGEYFIGNDVHLLQERRAPQRAPTPIAINRASDLVQGPSPFGSDVMSPLFAKGANGMPKSVSTPKTGTNGANGISHSP